MSEAQNEKMIEVSPTISVKPSPDMADRFDVRVHFTRRAHNRPSEREEVFGELGWNNLQREAVDAITSALNSVAAEFGMTSDGVTILDYTQAADAQEAFVRMLLDLCELSKQHPLHEVNRE